MNEVIDSFNVRKINRKNKIKTDHKRNAYNHIRREYRWLRRLIRPLVG